MSAMPQMTLDQQRAAAALTLVNKVKQQDKPGVAGEFAAQVKSVPAGIIINGFGQTLAILASHSGTDKDDKIACKALADGLAEWLVSGRSNSPLARVTPVTGLAVLEEMTKVDQRTYIWAQQEALAYLAWVKKLAVALLGDA